MLPHLQLYAWKAWATLSRNRVISQWEGCQFSSFSKTLGNRWIINICKTSVKQWNGQSHLGSDFSDLLGLWVMTVKNETYPLTQHQKLENWAMQFNGWLFVSFLYHFNLFLISVSVIFASFFCISRTCLSENILLVCTD